MSDPSSKEESEENEVKEVTESIHPRDVPLIVSKLRWSSLTDPSSRPLIIMMVMTIFLAMANACAAHASTFFFMGAPWSRPDSLKILPLITIVISLHRSLHLSIQ